MNGCMIWTNTKAGRIMRHVCAPTFFGRGMAIPFMHIGLRPEGFLMGRQFARLDRKLNCCGGDRVAFK